MYIRRWLLKDLLPLDFEKVDLAIDKANEQLNRVTIERRSRKLAIRGTFPGKAGEGKARRRYIALEIYANPDGVKVTLARV